MSRVVFGLVCWGAGWTSGVLIQALGAPLGVTILVSITAGLLIGWFGNE
jgi:hypothetical protein